MPRLPRVVMIISFDFALFSFRLFVAAHSSTCAISGNHDLVLVAGTTRYVLSACLKVRFADVTGCKSAAVTTYDAGPSAEPCDTGLYFRDRRALTIKSHTVIVFTKEIVYPVVDIVWYPQSRQFSHQGHVPHCIESLREVERENSYVLVGALLVSAFVDLQVSEPHNNNCFTFQLNSLNFVLLLYTFDVHTLPIILETAHD